MAKDSFKQKVVQLFNITIDLIQELKGKVDKSIEDSNRALQNSNINKSSIEGLVSQLEEIRKEVVKIERAVQNKNVQISVATMPSSVKEVFKLKAVHPRTVAEGKEASKVLEMRSINKIKNLGLKIFADRGIKNRVIESIKNTSIKDNADVVFIDFTSYKRGVVKSSRDKAYFVVLESKDMTTANIADLSSKGFNVIDTKYTADQIYNTLLIATKHGDLTGGIARE